MQKTEVLNLGLSFCSIGSGLPAPSGLLVVLVILIFIIIAGKMLQFTSYQVLVLPTPIIKALVVGILWMFLVIEFPKITIELRWFNMAVLVDDCPINILQQLRHKHP